MSSRLVANGCVTLLGSAARLEDAERLLLFEEDLVRFRFEESELLTGGI